MVVTMINNSKILSESILAGSVYFGLVAAAHLVRLKIPGLYIYFELPSYSFQDNIVALFALGWSIFFYTIAKDVLNNIRMVKAIIIAGAAAIIILSVTNIRTDFSSLSNSVEIRIIWFQTVLLFFYWLWLVVFYVKVKKERSPHAKQYSNTFR
jgi:hypothetical protein